MFVGESWIGCSGLTTHPSNLGKSTLEALDFTPVGRSNGHLAGAPSPFHH